MISRDLETGKYGGRVVTRFPPEPNGYLHIGHAKSICLNFGLAEEHEGGRCHLRFDDTNPTTEDLRFVEAIKEDIHWLGFDWGPHLYHASDYFEQLYDYGVELIEKGLAYIDSSTEEEIQEMRGSVTEAGRNSPFRDRPADENLDLFRRMRAGEFEDGAHVLRAKIDMAHPNMIMRDPVLVRIRHAHHYRRGDDWPIYPLYDFAHCLSDSIERITHSLCTLEFENNREIYDWLLMNTSAPEPRPEQTEFARLNLEYTVTSKRKLKALVEEGHVRGWDDPRMPTIAGLRRRGVTPEAIRSFCDMVGVAKANSTIDLAKLDYAIRNDLNYRAPRAFAVLDPVRVVITNYAKDQSETFEAPSFPKDVGKPGTRELPFGQELFIERADFSEDPPKGYRRLVPGGEVRLKHAYVIRLDRVVRDESGALSHLECSYDPETRGGVAPEDRKVAGTIHWVARDHAMPVTVRDYEPLFTTADPGEAEDFRDALNPASESVRAEAVAEAAVGNAEAGAHFQFERSGYFFADPVDSAPGRPVFNRVVGLRDGWKPPSDGTTTTDSPRKSGGERENRESGPGRDASPAAPGERGDPRDALRDDEQRRRFDEIVATGAPEGLAANLARDDELAPLHLAAATAAPGHGSGLAKWLVHEVARARDEGEGEVDRLGADDLGRLVVAVEAGEFSHHQGRGILESLLRGTAYDDAVSDLSAGADAGAIDGVLTALMAEHSDKVEAYRAGKEGLLGFFVGQVMRRAEGRPDPKLVSDRARALLGG